METINQAAAEILDQEPASETVFGDSNLLQMILENTHSTDDSTQAGFVNSLWLLQMKEVIVAQKKAVKVAGAQNIPASAAVQAINVNFSRDTTIKDQQIAHERAKLYLKSNLEGMGASFDIVTPGLGLDSCPTVAEAKASLPNAGGARLDSTVFTYETTQGVQQDIQRDGNRVSNGFVLYVVASQFNGCQAFDRNTPPPGNAYNEYQDNHTQGPGAQLQFPRAQVEEISRGANVGFNGLCNVLKNTTKRAVRHGYCTPTTDAQSDKFLTQLTKNGEHIEYPLIGNRPTQGSKTVHQLLVASPAYGEYSYEDRHGSYSMKNAEEIQFKIALQGFRATFEAALRLSEETERPGVVKPVAVGTGVFGNDPDVVYAAYYTAAKEYEGRLRDKEITVPFQVFRDLTGGGVAQFLNLQQFSSPPAG